MFAFENALGSAEGRTFLREDTHLKFKITPSKIKLDIHVLVNVFDLLPVLVEVIGRILTPYSSNNKGETFILLTALHSTYKSLSCRPSDRC